MIVVFIVFIIKFVAESLCLFYYRMGFQLRVETHEVCLSIKM